MAFNRTSALRYAEKYWNKPCSDGFFMVTDRAIRVDQKRTELNAPASDGWEALFVPDHDGSGRIVGESAMFQKPNGDEKLIQGWRGLADCAHYICKCLESGGVNLSEMSVPKLVKQLRKRADIKTLGQRLSRSQAQQILDLGVFKTGDVIAYFNVDPQGDYGGKADYTHSTLYLDKDGSGVGRIACHTVCRFKHMPKNDEWWLKQGSYAYTLLHFASDDPAANDAAHFEGWWKVQYFGRTEYYRFARTGTVRWTYTAPKTAADQAGGGAKHYGHWFQYPSEVRICWQSTGTSERWTVSGRRNSYDIKVNGHSGKAQKLFV